MGNPEYLSKTASAGREIVISRVIDASPELVWAAWTDPERIGQWWGPDGFTTTTHAIDVRPGGDWRFDMHKPDGRTYPNRITYLEVTAPERMVYAHRGEEDVEHVRFETTMTLERLEGGSTRLTLRMVFPSADERDRVAREYGAVAGGIQTVGRLAGHLAPASGRAGAALTLALPSAREVVVARTFDAPRARVFDAFTRPEHVKAWLWGPDDWRMTRCEIDLRVGGAYRYVWSNPQKGEIGLGGVYREIDAPARIVNTGLFDEDWTGGETVVTTLFEESGGRTTVTATVLYSSRHARDGAIATPMLDGWGQAYLRLDGFLAAPR